jgi:hypothetical protein
MQVELLPRSPAHGLQINCWIAHLLDSFDQSRHSEAFHDDLVALLRMAGSLRLPRLTLMLALSRDGANTYRSRDKIGISALVCRGRDNT